MHSTIGFIGAGNMGRPFICELRRLGYALTVHDIDARCQQWVQGQGATWADSPFRAAQTADVLITCLPLPEHVLQMMTGPQGALAALRPGSVWVDTSTTDYHNTLAIAAMATRRGVLSLEAPVSNLSHMGVDFNNVCFYAGGTTAAYGSAEGVLHAMGRHAFHVGDIGAGQSVKLLTNLLFYCAALVWAELLMVARFHGLDLLWLWQAATQSRGNCFVVDQVTPLMLDGSYDHSCTLEITVKDTALVVALADELQVPLRLGRHVQKRYAQAGDRYPARANHLQVVQLLEQENARSLQIPGFSAPSPYGADRTYRHPGPLQVDAQKRIKPALAQGYTHPVGRRGWDGTAQCLFEVMAWSNQLILSEAWQLGRAMGLDDVLLERVTSLSCGPSWVSDNPGKYGVDHALLRDFGGLARGLGLPILQALPATAPTLDGRQVWTL